jgi:hypothetical protein
LHACNMLLTVCGLTGLDWEEAVGGSVNLW